MTTGQWLLLALVSGLAFWLVALFNRLVALRHTVRAAWSDIEVQLKRRHDLIPRLVEAVRRYAPCEQATLERIVHLRNRSAGQTTPDRRGAVEAELERELHRLVALAEGYPELRASDNFLALQRDISEVERFIQHARRDYNGAVRRYNTRIEQFPDLLVARRLGFHPEEYFQAGMDMN